MLCVIYIPAKQPNIQVPKTITQHMSLAEVKLIQTTSVSGEPHLGTATWLVMFLSWRAEILEDAQKAHRPLGALA